LGERIEISLELSASVPDALADLGQLENALINLCINARDAMPEGGKLTIETSAAELDAAYAAQNLDVKPGHYAMVAVSDTGAGMSPETLERVFEPFFTTKEVNRGTGLGLSMVHGFVKQSGGHVKLYSEVGHGTTVRLYLPLADATAKEANGAAHAEAAPHRGDETILLVEDNALVRASGRSALRDLGYTVLEAEDGRGALVIIRSGAHIDLLFTDIVMPGITGVELADEATRTRPGLRVLFTSGYTDKAVTDHARLESGARFLSKPYRMHELAVRIREALDEQGPQAQQRA
jgi:CheY-like chemotaxis protein